MLRRTATIKKTILCIVILFIISYVYFFNNKQNVRKFSEQIKSDETFIDQNLKIKKREDEADVIFYDLGKNLEPASTYDQIKCRKSATFVVDTTLCVHPLEKDIWVSQSIWNNGFWEGNILRKFVSIINKCSNCLILDIGANIGQYTLFAAKLGRNVVAVEPFHDNILRIHKACKSEDLSSKIILIKNGISNKRNEVMRLVADTKNVGGQFLSNNLEGQNIDEKYIVKTILFDDLIKHIPKDSNGENFRKVIIKIDIEGFELYALENSKKFFNDYDVITIFMEWDKMALHPVNLHPKVEELISFFKSNGLMPHSIDNGPLIETDWTKWPQDVIWLKNNVN